MGMGLVIKRLAGLEAMFVIQIMYISMVWMNTFLYNPFKETVTLKFATGYSLDIFSNDNGNSESTVRILKQ